MQHQSAHQTVNQQQQQQQMFTPSQHQNTQFHQNLILNSGSAAAATAANNSGSGQPMQQPNENHLTTTAGFTFMTPITTSQQSNVNAHNPFQQTSQFTSVVGANGATTVQQQQQQILATSQMNYQMQPPQHAPQPQVHFIAKQQKFYGISPERAPLIFKHSSQDKRPYTSSGNVLTKRPSKNSNQQQSSAIAALYMNQSKTHSNGFGHNVHFQQASTQPRNSSQPNDPSNTISSDQHPAAQAYQMQPLPQRSTGFNANKSAMAKLSKGATSGGGTAHKSQSNYGQQSLLYSQSHTASVGGQQQSKLPEQLQMELMQFKQMANAHREENIKLKTKIRILENENGRKERTIEDFLQQNQFIQNAQKNSSNPGTLAPIVQTAQRYQAETFLVMSLKKQVKELKTELLKKDEDLVQTRKNIKNTKFYELDQEIKMYKDELIRLRYLLEQSISGNMQQQQMQTTVTQMSGSGRPSVNAFTTPVCLSPFMVPAQPPHSQNQSQPQIMNSIASQASASLKLASNSQSNLGFPLDSASIMSQQNGVNVPFAASQKVPSSNCQTLSNDDQFSNMTTETGIAQIQQQYQNQQNQLPPLKTTSPNLIQQFQQNQQSTPQQIQQQFQMSIQEQSSALSGALHPTNAINAPNATAFSQTLVDTRDNEFVQMLTHQLSDKDNRIRKLQQQVDEYSKSRLIRLQNSNNQLNATSQQEGGKGGSAGPISKTEFARVRKQLREKDKELQRLKNESAQASHANDEEMEKRVKQLQGQVSTYLKRTQELKNEIKKKDEKNEQLTKDLSQASNDLQKHKNTSAGDSSNKDKHPMTSVSQKRLQTRIDEMAKKMEEQKKENERLVEELDKQRKATNSVKLTPPKEQIIKEEVADKEPEQPKEEEKVTKEEKKKNAVEKNEEMKLDEKKQEDVKIKLDPKSEGELGLVSTVLGCRENRDRIEFANDLYEFVTKLGMSEEERKEMEKTHLGLASDYKLTLSPRLIDYIKHAKMVDLAFLMPKYEFITPSLALALMQEIRKMLMDPELFEILREKETETRLPFDALRDLCSRFDRVFTDEHCAFVTASYLTEINQGVIFINFKEFLSDLKDSRATADSTSKYRLTGSADGGSSEKRIMSRGSSPLSEILNRSGGKGLGRGGVGKRLDEEHMLDVSEAIFMKMADLLQSKGRTVRGIFTKYSVPEVFPDRTVLELISPGGFMQGIKEVGIDDLQEFEMACLMRVLAKPELDNSVILNEFVMIMENFGVLDHMEDEDIDDYISDSDNESLVSDADDEIKDETKNTATADKEELKEPLAAEKTKGKQDDNSSKEEKKASVEKDDGAAEKKKAGEPVALAVSKKKPRKHNLANIDAKGVKILRKLARFLLKQFLHPREFFGKAVTKEHIKTKKREFYIDVMKFKQFYLLIKIASIRKRLTENESLNAEICLDKKKYKDLINVKLMVKALEELAEEEQKTLLEEEKAEAAKQDKERNNQESKNTLGCSDVETPRSESDLKQQSEDDLGAENKAGKDKDKGGSPSPENDKDGEAKKLSSVSKEYGGLDIMKFGNASVHSKHLGAHSPMDRQFAHLNTIEEEKNETQTSNYIENASEREDSKLLSSNQLRGSQFGGGLEFESDGHKSSIPKLSPDDLDQTLSKYADLQHKRSSTSQVTHSPTASHEIDKVNANIELPIVGDERNCKNEGRLTGRVNSLKQHQLSKSMADASMKPIQIENTASNQLGNKITIPASESATLTPIIAQSKVQEGELSSTPREETANQQKPPANTEEQTQQQQVLTENTQKINLQQ